MAAIDEATELFFREGVFRYAEARATVSAYEGAAAAKVADIARARTHRLLGTNGKAEVAAAGVVNGDNGGRVAYAHFAGQLAKSALFGRSASGGLILLTALTLPSILSVGRGQTIW
jgi:hypothetical protein